MPWVTIQPAGVELEVDKGESVAEAAWRQGFTWPTKCYGQLDCVTCFARVLDGELSALPADSAEDDTKRLKMGPRFRTDPLIRLGCQLRVRKDGLVLEKIGFRREEATDNNMATNMADNRSATAAPAAAEPRSGRTRTDDDH